VQVRFGPPSAGGKWRVSPTNYGEFYGAFGYYTNYTDISRLLVFHNPNFAIEVTDVPGFVTPTRGPEMTAVMRQRLNRENTFGWNARPGRNRRLRNTDPHKLAAFLEKEHPQTTALIMAHLDPPHASSILAKLPDELRILIVKRMAQIRQFSPEVTETISSVLLQKLGQGREEKKQVSVRPENVSELMNHLEPTTSRTILEAIEKENAELANDIRNLMFTFEDLVGIPETALRDWLAAVDKKTLGLALKGASEQVRDHIFKAMSSRAVEMMKEDIEALGRVRSKEVTKAQQEAVAIARTLEAEGKITLRAEKDDDFVS